MKNIWSRIESWFSVNDPKAKIRLLEGTTDEQINEAEAFFNIQFPEDFRDSLSIHDGQHLLATPLMKSWQLFPLKEMIKDWKIMKNLYDDGQFSDTNVTSIGSVKAEWWHPLWIAIAHNGAGDLLCLDLQPASNGNIGQIISFLHMDSKREVVASSFRAWLQGFADDLEKGKNEKC